jgi:acyl-CoA dehydrogenase
VTRKVPMSGGAVVAAYLAELRELIDAVRAANDPAFGATAPRLTAAADALEDATRWLLATLASNPDAALAGATSYLRLFGATSGGCMLAAEALAASRQADGADKPGRIAIARFFAENIAVQAPALAQIVTEGADAALNGTAGIGHR